MSKSPRPIKVALVLLAAAASQAAERPEFEVASVKPSAPDARYSFRPSPGRLSVSGLPLAQLVAIGYRLQAYQLTGLPGWASTERYDVTARAEGNPKMDQIFAMVQTLLEDRFHLTYHREQRELNGYVLTAKAGGKRGPDLRPADEKECPPPGRGAPPAPPPPPPAGKPACGAMSSGFANGLITMQMRAVNMANITALLAGNIHEPVANETGIEGRFDATLSWAPDMNAGRPALAMQRTPANTLPPPSPGPSIFTAFEEQLGLKVAARKATLEMFVVDHVERPAAD